MTPKGHLICGTALAMTLWVLGIDLFPIFIIACASILIDVDHAINFIFKFRKFNIFEMNTYFRREANFRTSYIPLPVFIFHNYETLFILGLLSQFFPFVTYMLAGVIFHMVIDWGVMPTDRYPAVIKMSLIAVLIENRRRRKRGEIYW